MNSEAPFVIAMVSLSPVAVRETCGGDVEHMMARLSEARMPVAHWHRWISMVRRVGLGEAKAAFERAHRRYTIWNLYGNTIHAVPAGEDCPYGGGQVMDVVAIDTADAMRRYHEICAARGRATVPPGEDDDDRALPWWAR